MDDPREQKRNTRARKLLVEWLGNESAEERRTQSGLARHLGVAQPTVSAWLDGSARPEEYLREAIEVVTGIPADAWRTPMESARVAAVRADSAACAASQSPATGTEG